MTRWSALAVLLAAAVLSSATAPKDNRGLEEQLVALEKQSWVAWKARDGKFFDSFLADDHVEVASYGVTDKRTVVAGVASHDCVVDSYSVGGFHLTVFDANTALLTYRAEQTTKCGGVPVPSPVWVSSLFRRENGRWVNALYQQTKAG